MLCIFLPAFIISQLEGKPRGFEIRLGLGCCDRNVSVTDKRFGKIYLNGEIGWKGCHLPVDVTDVWKLNFEGRQCRLRETSFQLLTVFGRRKAGDMHGCPHDWFIADVIRLEWNAAWAILKKSR